MTKRTKGIRCVTCSGQKCQHMNIYRDEAKQNLVVSERLKEKAKKTTEVVGELELPLEPIVEEGEEDEVRNETNPHLQKGKKANVFNVKIKYPPTDEEKKDIKRINIEDIFPNDIAAPTLEGDEECEHGNRFSPTLDPENIESRKVLIHHTQEAKDSNNSSLVLMFLRTEGGVCDCKKHFTGKNVLRKLLLMVKIYQAKKRSC